MSVDPASGEAGRDIWKAFLPAQEEGGPYNVTMSSSGCALSISNVLFGDVWFCSGQSNMVYPLRYVRRKTHSDACM